MKWLKDLFKDPNLDGLANNTDKQSSVKPATVKPEDSRYKDGRIVNDPLTSQARTEKTLSLQESISRHKKETEELEKKMFEVDNNQEIIPTLPEGMSFDDPNIRKPKSKDPNAYLAVKVPLSQLSPIQRQYSSYIMDHGFIFWNMTKAEPITRGLFIEKKIKSLENENIYKEYLQAKETGDYKLFPFDDSLMGEIRGRILDKLTTEDTEENLLNRFYNLLPHYASDEDITIIKSLVEMTKTELSRRTYTFPFSTKDDLLRDEVRTDGLDLLGLKELVESMEGDDVEQINLMTGFFSRMTEFFNAVYDQLYPNPIELNSKGFYRFTKYGKLPNHISGIILAVKNNKLLHIKVARVYRSNRMIDLPLARHDDTTYLEQYRKAGIRDYGLNDYSPVVASYCMFMTYNIKQYITLLTEEEKTKNGAISDWMNTTLVKTELDPKKGDALDHANYYVIVDGCIAGPKDFSYEMGGLIKNTERIKAGEVFYYHRLDGKNNAVRLGFTPHWYDQIHPMLRTGGLVLGNSDMTHHSTTRCSGNFAESTVNDYKTWWASLVKASDTSQGDAYSPAMVSGYLHNLMKQPTTNSCFTLELLKKENYRYLEGVLHSIWEETEFTLFWNQKTVWLVDIGYSIDIKNETEAKYGKKFAPLNRVWNIKKYMEDGLGVMPERQESMIRYLCKKFEDNHNEKTIKLWLQLHHQGFLGKKAS